VPDGPLRITYVGHATTLLELDGVSILTDPVLRQRVAHLRRLSPMQPAPLNGVVNPDGILVSHLHFDHFDVRSLRKFDPGITILVPHGGAVQFLRRFAFSDVRGVQEGADVSFGPVQVRAVHAQHSVVPGASRIVGPALGYVLEGSASVYFAGDTDVFPEMSELSGTDVALLPVAGWGPRLPEGDHMNPLRAAESLKVLKPRVAIPIHWGTFAPVWAREGYPEQAAAPEQFRQHAAQIAPEVEVRILQPGETFTLA
jgi:L-ascorbate metabolism protein UlaG (beta-lactamase superfamily)